MDGSTLTRCPIAVTGMACVIPGALNTDEFWMRLMEGVPLVKPLPESRWSSALYMSPNRAIKEKTYSRHAAHLEEELYRRLGEKWGEKEPNRFLMRLQLLECAEKLFAAFPEDSRKGKIIDNFIGCMHLDEANGWGAFTLENEDIREYIQAHGGEHREEWLQRWGNFVETVLKPNQRSEIQLISGLNHELAERYGLKGAAASIDAACASSVASVEVGVRRLLSGESDMVLTGGIESFLTPMAFVSFTSVGALAPEVSLPFDKRSQGVSLGEGCVLFMLERLPDALREGRKIHAVIEGIGASSDGKAASLFSPTVAGQKRAYRSAYHELDLDRLVYLEAHGTGTVLGDAVELQSSQEFFGERKLPIGSAKSLWGHLRGAAGSLGMLKAIQILQRKQVTPSRYYKEKIEGFANNLYLNTEMEEWKLPEGKPALVGVSSFGFGGINYHIALGEWNAEREAQMKASLAGAESGPAAFTPYKPVPKAMVAGYYELETQDLLKKINWSEFKVPARTREQIDTAQLGALLAAKKALDGFPLGLVDRSKVVVICASQLGLENIKVFANRLNYQEMRLLFKDAPPEFIEGLVDIRQKFAPISEDTSAGGLNNVVAGRICNHFDFHGKSYNVDADSQSWPAGLQAALYELRDDAELVILIGIDHRSLDDGDLDEYLKASATLLVTEATAKRLALQVKYEILGVEACS